MRTLRTSFALLLLLAPFGFATGPNSFRPRQVDWSDIVYVPAWSADAPLPQAVVLRYQRWASASGRAENLLDAPVGVVFSHHVRMELRIPNGRLLDLSNREGHEARLLAAFDGLEDYTGVSAASLATVGGETTTIVMTDPADIAYFAGFGGEVPLTIAATGEASFQGPIGLRQEVDVRAGLRVTVEYVFSAP